MTRYITIYSIVLSILALSLKDTLTIAHTFLHRIPNAFHFHDHVHDHHHGHHHDFMDHLVQDHDYATNSHQEKLPSGEKEKGSVGKDMKINWFVNGEHRPKMDLYFSSVQSTVFFLLHPYTTLLNSPPVPPPESV